MVNPAKVISGLLKAEEEIGAYITSPGGNLFERWYKDRFKDRCNEFANLPPWARALSGVSGGSISRICRPYWDEQGVDGPVLAPPPFNGGQCNAKRYLLRMSWENQVGTRSNLPSKLILGPLGGVRLDPPDGGPVTLLIINARGEKSGTCSDTSPALGDQRDIVAGQQSAIRRNLRIDSLTACDGVDDCGNPPSPGPIPGPNPPPNPGPQPGPEPTDDPDGGPIPIVPIPPYDDPVFGPQPFDPGPDGDGGGPGEPQPPAGGDGLPGSPDSVAPPVGQTGNDGEGEDFPFGPPPAGQVWVGVLIENTVDPRYGNIPGTGPQNTVYPYVIGNASLIYSGGFSSSSRMRSRWHEMFRPVTALEVTGARVQCRPGVSASVRPVSATICPENTCGE